jgi:xylitol oxidase
VTELATWAGTYQFTARRVIEAHSVDDVCRAVAAGGRVRALGTRHSFNDLADNGATLVTVTGIPPAPVLDEAARTVTVGAGTTYGALATWLQERGWALGNMASLPHISVAGAIATGTHGSGSRNQVLSAAVAGLDYVAADGEVRHADRGERDFAGMAVGLGAFGVVVRVTLDVEPTYQVRQDVYAGPAWDRLLADLTSVMSAGYSVSLFTDWSGDPVQAWVKRRVGSPAGMVPEEFFGAGRFTGQVRLADAPADNLTPHGVAGPWSHRLPHFRIDSVPSNGNEIQSEYFVGAEHGPAALDAVRRLARQVAPLLLVCEIRAIGALAQRRVRPRDGGDPLHLAQAPPAGRRGAGPHRGSARALRRPAALGQGLARPTGRTGAALPPASRCQRVVRAPRPGRPVQRPPPRAARRPRAQVTARDAIGPEAAARTPAPSAGQWRRSRRPLPLPARHRPRRRR